MHNETILCESLGFFIGYLVEKEKQEESLMVCAFYFLLWLQTVQLYFDLFDKLGLHVRIYFIIGF